MEVVGPVTSRSDSLLGRLGRPGTYFVLPPRHRMFVVFDSPDQATKAMRRLAKLHMISEDDVWRFFGDEGMRRLDPSARHHGLGVEVVRVFQRAMTADCEYCEGLRDALRAGAMVVAIKIEEEEIDDAMDVVRAYGGHDVAYGAHWNFVPISGAGQAIGSLRQVD